MDKAPDAYRTISEVGEDLDLPQHVLRFWETRFPQIKPLKRGGGRRYYRPDDVELLKGIRHLLYKEGYTIKGVQRILKEQGGRAVMAWARPVEYVEDLPEALPPEPALHQPVIQPALPVAVSPPPAYAPPPPVIAPPPEPAPVLVSAPPSVMAPLLPPAPAAPLFELPDLGMPPMASEPVVLPELVAPASAPQVSMFRGGLQRAEAQPDLPLLSTAPPQPVPQASVFFGTSAYPAPVAPPMGQARPLLVQALEELSGARVALDRLLATRAPQPA